MVTRLTSCSVLFVRHYKLCLRDSTKNRYHRIINNDNQPVRDDFAAGGIHARVWAFNGATSFFSHNVSREKAPSGYIDMDDQYVLRYVSEIVPNL
jgi:hypothetical protein